jgi:hypothetical protein
LQCSIPSTTGFHKITQASRPRDELVGPVSVARVRPRTSKGITACWSQTRDVCDTPGQTSVEAPAPPALRPAGSRGGGLVTQRIARTLNHRTVAHCLARVATAQRYLGSPQDRPDPIGSRRSLYQLMSPTQDARGHPLRPAEEGSFNEDQALD